MAGEHLLLREGQAGGCWYSAQGIQNPAATQAKPQGTRSHVKPKVMETGGEKVWAGCAPTSVRSWQAMEGL